MPKTITPLLSIGLPVYNGENYLEMAIQSIITQSFKDFELILVDNASSDHTADICKKYAQIDDRIEVFRNKENIGAAGNFNIAFNLSRGKYFKWAAHDDILLPGYLEKCINTLETRLDAVLCYPRSGIINGLEKEEIPYEDGLDLQSDFPHMRYHQFHSLYYPGMNTYCNPIFGIFRSDVLRKTPLIGNYTSSDMVLLGEVTLWGKIVEVDDRLFLRREHSMRSTRVYSDYKTRDEWFDPKKHGRIQMSTWRWGKEYWKSIVRVPLSGKEKILCLLELFKWYRISWKSALLPELKFAVLELLKRKKTIYKIVKLFRN